MTATLEQQLIDNENRVALMAAIIAGATVIANTGQTIDARKLVVNSVAIAKMITSEVGKEAEKVRGEL